MKSYMRILCINLWWIAMGSLSAFLEYTPPRQALPPMIIYCVINWFYRNVGHPFSVIYDQDAANVTCHSMYILSYMHTICTSSYFWYYWPFVRGIRRSPVNSLYSNVELWCCWRKPEKRLHQKSSYRWVQTPLGPCDILVSVVIWYRSTLSGAIKVNSLTHKKQKTSTTKHVHILRGIRYKVGLKSNCRIWIQKVSMKLSCDFHEFWKKHILSADGQFMFISSETVVQFQSLCAANEKGDKGKDLFSVYRNLLYNQLNLWIIKHRTDSKLVHI